MQSHLTLLADGKPLALNPDQSIDINFQNPLFNDTEMFSYPFSLPIEGNRQYVQNIDHPDAEIRSIDLEHTPMQILVDGMPFASGTSVLSDGESIEDSFSMQVNAASRSFQDLIGTLQCRDLVIPDKYREQCRIGEKIGNLRVEVVYDTQVHVQYESTGKGGKNEHHTYGSAGGGLKMGDIFEPQALGFSYPAQCLIKNSSTQEAQSSPFTYQNNNTVQRPKVATSYINTNAAYLDTDAAGRPAVYCNARIAYKHYDLDDDGKTSSGVVQVDMEKNRNEPENHGKYWVLDANRPQSGICFYVLFFLDVLFDNLGVTFDKSALMAIEDMRHLCFFTTRCKYDTEVLHYSTDMFDKSRDLVYMDDDNWYVKDTLDIEYVEKSNGTTEQQYKKIPSTIKLDVRRDSNGSVIRDSQGRPEPILNKPWMYYTAGDRAHAFDKVNTWLSSRGCGAELSIPDPIDKSVQSLTLQTRKRQFGGAFWGDWVTENVVVGTNNCQSITIKSTITSVKSSANIMAMFANSENFPDASVSDILDSLENAFGIKFDYDYEQRKVTAYLRRDLFRKRQSKQPIPMHGKFDQFIPVSEKITGVRHCYSAESDTKEQRQNVKYGTRDYDTSYDYIEYRDPLASDRPNLDGQSDPLALNGVNPYGTMRSTTDASKTYSEIVSSGLSSTNMTCYIDRTTGNAYRIKVDADANTAEEMKPVLFEVGQWKGVSYGDCSEENEDFVQEFSIGFTPVDFNDVNAARYLKDLMETPISKRLDKDEDTQYKVSNFNFDSQPLLVAFCSEDMEHEFVEQHLNNLLSSSVADIYVQSKLKLIESYDPTKTDDGNSPLQEYDWGMSIALMRGGGSDATIQEYDYNYDFFGNSKWLMTSGNYALASDTLDQYGTPYDYNGKQSGIGSGERFSLKIRAFKDDLAPWAKERGIVLCDDDHYDEDGNFAWKIRTRGLFDTFMIDYAYFLLHRHRYKVPCTLSAAQIADIPNHWLDWWLIDGRQCLINTASVSINAAEGINNVELEVFSL